MHNDIEINEVADDPALLGNITIDFVHDRETNFYNTYLNGENVEEEIRTIEVARLSSQVSTLSEVRRFLVHQQQRMGQEKGVVMDGRDIGTVVFPDAELKIFMTASTEVRAKRRYLQLQKRGVDVSYPDVLHSIRERDQMDSLREESPLIKADDAITLDNSSMTPEEQAKIALKWAKGVIKAMQEVG